MGHTVWAGRMGTAHPSPAQISHLLHPSVSWLVLALSCHCPVVPCVWVGPGTVFWGYPMDLSVSVSYLSVCLSSQASCVTALHPVSSAPVLIGHQQSWSPLTASSPPHSVSPTTALGPQHCHRGHPPACLPVLWPLEPSTGPWATKTPQAQPTHPPTCQELTLWFLLQPSPWPRPRGGLLESAWRGP